jgi:hypothetical protein
MRRIAASPIREGQKAQVENMLALLVRPEQTGHIQVFNKIDLLHDRFLQAIARHEPTVRPAPSVKVPPRRARRKLFSF